MHGGLTTQSGFSRFILLRRVGNQCGVCGFLLRKRFGAERVVVFGSLAHKGCFTRWSDVDVAAWGLRAEDTFRAIGAVQDLDFEIAVNLTDVGTCSPSLLEVIQQEGVEV